MVQACVRALAPALAIVAVLGLGCGASSNTPAVPSRNWTDAPAVVTLTGTTEIDVVGDLHGDNVVAATLLSAAGLITTSTPFHWKGGSRVLVVTGDVIDKGTFSLPIIDLLTTIEAEAQAAGGRVIVTLGNHEAEFLADPTGSKSKEFQAELTRQGLDPKKVATGTPPYGAWLLSRPIAALIDGWFFCHAGNSGGLSASAIGQTFQQRVEQKSSKSDKNPYDDTFFTGADSLLEAQFWWSKGSADAKTTIDADLAGLPASHVVFGHDPGALSFSGDPLGDRGRGEMATRYDGRIFLIDVGMSSAIGYSQGALMRINRGVADTVTAVFADGTSKTLWP